MKQLFSTDSLHEIEQAETLYAIAAGTISPEKLVEAKRHLKACLQCRIGLVSLRRALREAEDDPLTPETEARILDKTQKAISRIEHDKTRAAVSQQEGDEFAERGQFFDAEEKYVEAKRLFKDCEDGLGIARVLRKMGTIALESGRYIEACTRFEEAREEYRKERSCLGMADCLIGRGSAAIGLEKHSEAVELFLSAIDIFRKEGIARAVADCDYYLGMAYRLIGNKSIAGSRYNHALRGYERANDAVGQARTLIAWAAMRLRTPGDQKAFGMLDQASHLLQGKRREEDAGCNAEVEVLLAKARYYRGDYEGAAGELRDYVERHLTGEDNGIVECVLTLADVEVAVGRLDVAKEHYRLALDRFERYGNQRGEARCLRALSTICNDLGSRDEARHYAQRCEAVIRALGPEDSLQLKREMAAPERQFRSGFCA